MRRYGTEFVASAVVVWSACACVTLGALQAALAVGGILAVVMIAGAGVVHVSPVVSAVLWVHGGLTGRELVGRLVAQLGGAVAAACIARLALAAPPTGVAPGQGVVAVVVAEGVGALVVGYGVVGVLPGRSGSGRYGAGAIAGIAVAACVVATSGPSVTTGAPVTGFNPAAAVAMAAFGASSWLMVLAVAPAHLLAAAVAAALVRPQVEVVSTVSTVPVSVVAASDAEGSTGGEVRLPAPRRSAEDMRPVARSA